MAHDMAVAFVALDVLVASRETAAEVIGKVAMVVCVSLFASPLTVIRVVLETKSSKSIPLPFTVAMTINCFLWTVFGLWQAHDANIYIPNGLGLVFSLTQVGLKLYFEDNVLHNFRRKAVGRRKSLERNNDGDDDDDGDNSIKEISQPLIGKAAESSATKRAIETRLSV